MKIRKKSQKSIIKTIKKKIFSNIFMKKNRVSGKDFTRKRKLPFTSLILFMINIIKQTTQKELTNFIKLVKGDNMNISKSAFSQSRIKLKPEAFIELNDTLIEEFYTDNIYETWKGFRLIAMDGSKISLPINSSELKEKFGTLSSGMIIPEAQISNCYDPLNDMIIDAQIEPLRCNELSLALRHIEKLNKNDLILLDRGYGSTWFYKYMIDRKLNFVNRISKNFIKDANLFWNSKEESKIIEVTHYPQKSRNKLNELKIKLEPFKIRLVKVDLGNGEIEVIATTLLDEKKYPNNIFKKLYFKRWGIEINYDHLKNNIRLGDFTGLSEISIRQDFYVSTFISNLQSLISKDCEEELKKNNYTRYDYKVNRNLTLGFMKDRVVDIFLDKKIDTYEELVELFKMNPVPIRKGRKNPRVFHRSRRKYSMNNKRSV